MYIYIILYIYTYQCVYIYDGHPFQNSMMGIIIMGIQLHLNNLNRLMTVPKYWYPTFDLGTYDHPPKVVKPAAGLTMVQVGHIQQAVHRLLISSSPAFTSFCHVFWRTPTLRFLGRNPTCTYDSCFQNHPKKNGKNMSLVRYPCSHFGSCEVPALPRGASIPWCAPCERPHTSSREDRGDILGSGEQMQTNVVEVMLTQKKLVET